MKPLDWVNAFLACVFMLIAIAEASSGQAIPAFISVAVALLCLYDIWRRDP